jgi:AcrR family transcriptional regulator
MTEATTRHERRKQRTRALIRETAWELFAAHGYDATTIKAIADAADVAPRTVTVHFPAKDDLLFADDDYFGATSSDGDSPPARPGCRRWRPCASG